jgi:general stress protein 26
MPSSELSDNSRPMSAKNQGHKDGLYFVMWKLDRLAKNELNKGQTTAFKRC